MLADDLGRMTGKSEVIPRWGLPTTRPECFWARTTLLPVAEPVISLTHNRLRVQALANATYHWSGCF